MHHNVARGAGVLAALTGAGSLTLDVLTWSGVGPGVRLDQHAVLMACSIILTLIWATNAVVRSEQRPLVKEIARQRGAVRDIETKLDSTEQATTAAFERALNHARWEGYGQCLSDIGADSTVVPMRRNHRSN
jgi:hypothetical protein